MSDVLVSYSFTHPFVFLTVNFEECRQTRVYGIGWFLVVFWCGLCHLVNIFAFLSRATLGYRTNGTPLQQGFHLPALQHYTRNQLYTPLCIAFITYSRHNSQATKVCSGVFFVDRKDDSLSVMVRLLGKRSSKISFKWSHEWTSHRLRVMTFFKPQKETGWFNQHLYRLLDADSWFEDRFHRVYLNYIRIYGMYVVYSFSSYSMFYTNILLHISH